MNTYSKLLISTTFLITLIVVCYLIVRYMINPIKGKITSKYGNRVHPVTGIASFHNGVDISAPIGTDILSPADGKVVLLNSTTHGGNQLVIKHTNGYSTGYAHLSAYNVKLGDEVKQGSKIAKTGNTGIGTGAHLHFTLTNPAGAKVDPLSIFKFT